MEFKEVFLPPKKKVTSTINLVVTLIVSDYLGKTSQRFHAKIDQHVPKFLKSWFDRHLNKSAEKYFSAIGQYLLNNHKCARNYMEENFLVLVKAENFF